MLVTCQQMQDIESQAFATGIHPADLMQQAGAGIAAEIRRFHPRPGTLILYLGTGNNAGDALVAARELQEDGWQIHLRLSGPVDRLKPLPARHLKAIPALCHLSSPPRPALLTRPIVQLDGLLGIGARGPLREDIRALTAEMNQQRQQHLAITIAMDIPTGLDADTGIPAPDTVIADLTITIGHAKKGLIADTAINHVGRLALVPLSDLAASEDSSSREQLLTPELLRPWAPQRPFDFHKGQAGRIGLIAGSAGYHGAAILACLGALRAGGGLVTLFVKEDAYSVLAAKAPPEVMVKLVKDYREALDLPFNALGIGPGIGLTAEDEILEIIRRAPLPCIIDADALTLLARDPSAVLASASAPRLLTPHPGEMQRLMPGIQQETRLTQARLAAERFKVHTILLKGARTIITAHGQTTAYNSTGHPGMATGGMGDVLTGVCTALSAQGLPLPQAAALAAWTSGRAAELAALTHGQNAVLPSDVAQHLGAAFAELA